MQLSFAWISVEYNLCVLLQPSAADNPLCVCLSVVGCFFFFSLIPHLWHGHWMKSEKHAVGILYTAAKSNKTKPQQQTKQEETKAHCLIATSLSSADEFPWRPDSILQALVKRHYGGKFVCWYTKLFSSIKFICGAVRRYLHDEAIILPC